MSYQSHPTAEVQTTNIGAGTTVWQHTVILAGAAIGTNVNICSHCFIENDVVVGDNVTIKAGVQLWDGVRLADNVFVGPNVSFSNDKYPVSKSRPSRYSVTVIQKGASIGSGAVILPGVTVGAGAMIAAGAVVTKSVPANAIIKGNPGRISGYRGLRDIEPQADSIHIQEDGSDGALLVGSGAKLLRFWSTEDLRGKLAVGNVPKDIPFDPKRFFTVYDVPTGKVRGEHAHIACEQFLICLAGSCKVMLDTGSSRCEVILDSPDKGLYVPPLTWATQYQHTPGSVLLVFASHEYEEQDYIRDYDDFINRVN